MSVGISALMLIAKDVVDFFWWLSTSFLAMHALLSPDFKTIGIVLSMQQGVHATRGACREVDCFEGNRNNT